ncbi:lysophospholipid acyltransferase family protein [Acuticoccus mangrovi]|uniref:Lipid A biosynthesis lauroyl acyltransferase n=1 Tax=Acuticoccus mangrovi TaxID=2796142 RepID=A0A934MFA9_9HYPH|nr:hypothetical protein [Acuticoccus mangrovi]
MPTQSANSAPPKRRHAKRGFERTLLGLRYRLEYVLVRVVGFGLRHIPVEMASGLMGAIMGLVMPLTARHARALEHLRFALPELEEAERRSIARRMWVHLGRVAGESFQIDKIMADTRRVSLPPDFDHFRELCRDGAINAAVHLGNWEIGGVMPRAAGLQLAGVYQPLHNPYVERYLKSLRASAYPAGLFAKGPKVGHTLVNLVRQGAGIGLVADFREMRGVGVTFFGQPAFATPLPAMLARATGRPIIAGAVIRTHGVHFRGVLAHVPVKQTDDRERDIAEATQALHDVYERWIREAPEQWMWTHRKWARSRRRELTVATAEPDEAAASSDTAPDHAEVVAPPGPLPAQSAPEPERAARSR